MHLRSAFALVALCTFALAGCGGTQHFIARVGDRLTLGGHTWRFVGFNDYELPSVPGKTHCGRTVDQRTLDSVMQDARHSGASVIRTWFFQSYYDMSNATRHSQQVAPTWTAFDRVLHAAAAHHLMVIPVLVNEWPNCEPAPVSKDIVFYRTGYTRPGYGYPLSFKRYATTVARHYANNATIAFWQLGNELQVNSARCDERASARALRPFADKMTSAVKAVDPHHLVSLGTIGYNECGLDGTDYQYVHAGLVDLCETHDYSMASVSISSGTDSLARRIAQCDALHKPMFVGESGIPADTDDLGQSSGKITSTSLELRAGFFEAKMTAAFNAGIAGYLIWDKRQDPSNSLLNYYLGRYMVGPGDPTDTVMATISRTFGRAPGTVRFSFEDGGVDGWRVASASNRLILSSSTVEAWDGTHSLLLTIQARARLAVAATSVTAGAVGANTITYHVYLPSHTPPGADALPYIADAKGSHPLAPPTRLHPGWNVVQWTIPRGVRTPLRSIGLQLDNPLGRNLYLFLDGVSW